MKKKLLQRQGLLLVIAIALTLLISVNIIPQRI